MNAYPDVVRADFMHFYAGQGFLLAPTEIRSPPKLHSRVVGLHTVCHQSPNLTRVQLFGVCDDRNLV